MEVTELRKTVVKRSLESIWEGSHREIVGEQFEHLLVNIESTETLTVVVGFDIANRQEETIHLLGVVFFIATHEMLQVALQPVHLFGLFYLLDVSEAFEEARGEEVEVAIAVQLGVDLVFADDGVEDGDEAMATEHLVGMGEQGDQELFQ